jgi:hypothetical protein
MTTTMPPDPHPSDVDPVGYFYERAQANGVPEDLADLGRQVMRRALEQTHWNDYQRGLYTWDKMLSLVLSQPQSARDEWEYLLATDMLRLEGPEVGPT